MKRVEAEAHLGDKTKVPFVWVAVAIPFFITAILWLASVDSKASQATANASEAKGQLSGLQEKLVDIRERLIRIEDALSQNH